MRDIAHNTHTHKIVSKGKYRLLEIRDRDGAQKFYSLNASTTPHDKIIWLMGIERYQNARVGMEGEIHYMSSSTIGRHFFVEKEQTECFI